MTGAFTKQSEDETLRTMAMFAGGAMKPGFNLAKEHETLCNAYRTFLNADVRFVPYKQIGKEPPCAGIDYRPPK